MAGRHISGHRLKDFAMNCPCCGAELPEDADAEYCSVCGTQIRKKSGIIRIFPVISLVFGIISLICAVSGPEFGFLGLFGIGFGCFRTGKPDRFLWVSITGIMMSAAAVVIFVLRISGYAR